jgi:hypothetical protein
MHTMAAFLVFSLFVGGGSNLSGDRSQAKDPPVSSQDSYSSIHKLHQAHALSLGRGARVGILDHSFQAQAHPELYAGFVEFLPPESRLPQASESNRGYWMTLALAETAPEAQVFALNTYHPDEDLRVEAMVRAIDWAINEGLDAVTYCSEPFSKEAREKLDPAVTRAVASGVVVIFANYFHPLNILPGGLGQPEPLGTRAPDLRIFSYECAVAVADEVVALMDPDDDRISRFRPSLARPSAGPVAAGLVALVRSLAPEISPVEVKRILMETSRPLLFQGAQEDKVPDAYAALARVRGDGS